MDLLQTTEPHSAATPPSSTANGESLPSEENAANGESQHASITVMRTSWSFGEDFPIARDDKWSCFVFIFSFWFFVSVTMILGVYGSIDVVLGPDSSIVFQPSPVFVKYVKAENLEAKPGPGPILYGTYQYPLLDVVDTWEETRNVSIPYGSYEKWRYYLNRGSEVNISYSLSSENSSIILVIAEDLSMWLQDPAYPNTTLSWNVIHGTGMISQEIFKSSSYYVALGNLEADVEVELNISVRAFLHNTTNAYYKCALSSSPCSLNIFFPEGNAVVLVSPGPQQNTSNNEWCIKLSYGPRWLTYIFGIGGLTLLMFTAVSFLNKFQCAHEDRVGVRTGGTAPESAPLLSRKDDISSWGSSYDSLPPDEEDLDFKGDSIDGKLLGDGETSNNTQRLCAICFDAPRDCFFLPCGHCVACFACGTRIVEVAGTCPVCRRNMKKVRKIFTV